MNTPKYEDFRAFATSLASFAGMQCARDFRRVEVKRKADDSEVTSTDLCIQATIAERIAGVFPDHALLAEEDIGPGAGLPPPGTTPYCWVVDPVDGTRNFARGLPCYCTSIALLEAGRPVVGVIREHATGITYSAAHGSGAWAGTEPMRVSTTGLDSRSVISFQPAHSAQAYARVQEWLTVVNVRNLGSTALHIALLAAGALDGSFGEDCYVWDIAAGAVMLEMAGGIITDPAGRGIFPFDLVNAPRQRIPFVAGGKDMHQQLIARLGR